MHLRCGGSWLWLFSAPAASERASEEAVNGSVRGPWSAIKPCSQFTQLHIKRQCNINEGSKLNKLSILFNDIARTHLLFTVTVRVNHPRCRARDATADAPRRAPTVAFDL